MKWSAFYKAVFPLLLLAGCADAHDASIGKKVSCEALNVSPQARILVGTDLSTVEQFSSKPLIEPALFTTDMGGAVLSLLINEVDPHNATLSFEEPGINFEQVETRFTCINEGAAQNTEVALKAVEGGVLLKFKERVFNIFSYDGWIFLKKK